MSEIWFTSDHHFFHANILKFTGDDGKLIRPEFSCEEEMNEVMAQRWNDAIKPQDHVYHLGDVTFRYDRPFTALMHRLNGRKRLVVGNHDKLKSRGFLDHFEKVMLWRGFKAHNFTCTHMPIRLDSLRDGKFNVHGHIHQRVMADPHYINISVEQTDYRPVHLDELCDMIQKRA